MAASNYSVCLAKVLLNEGGNVDNPKDPGGRTSRGVTQAVYDAFRKSHGLAKKDVWKATDKEVADIYKSGYWNKVKGDALPVGVDYVTFDGGVNSGPSRSVKWLQKAVGVKQDGVCGPDTIGHATNADGRKTIVAYCAARTAFVRGLSTFKTFGKGWINRITKSEADAVAMHLKAKGTPQASLVSELKATSTKAAATAKTQVTSAGTAGTSGGATATQIDLTHMSSATPWIIAGCAVALVVLAVVLIHKSRVNKSRSEAYAAAAKEAQP